MGERLSPDVMAMLIARSFREGDVINLGTGMPTLCSTYCPPDMEVLFHSEQGLVGFGPVMAEPPTPDYPLRNAGGQFVQALPGMSFMSHDESFDLVRGGFLDYTILGGLQVDREGNLANFQRPGRVTGSVGGAPDLAARARHTFVMMTHTARSGEPKIVERCTLPLTAARCVDKIFTDVAVMRLEAGAVIVEEYAPGWTLEEIQAITGVPLQAAADMREASLVA